MPVHIQRVGAGRHVAEIPDQRADGVEHDRDLALRSYGTCRVVDIGYGEPLDPLAQPVNRQPVIVDIIIVHMSVAVHVRIRIEDINEFQ